MAELSRRVTCLFSASSPEWCVEPVIEEVLEYREPVSNVVKSRNIPE